MYLRAFYATIQPQFGKLIGRFFKTNCWAEKISGMKFFFFFFLAFIRAWRGVIECGNSWGLCAHTVIGNRNFHFGCFSTILINCIQRNIIAFKTVDFLKNVRGAPDISFSIQCRYRHIFLFAGVLCALSANYVIFF